MLYEVITLSLDEFVHHAGAERAGPVEREHGDDVFEAVRAEHAQVFAHARAFDLEDAVGVALGEDGEGVGVVEVQRVEVRGLLALLADDVQSYNFV